MIMRCSESKIDNKNLFSNTTDNFFYHLLVCTCANSHLQSKKMNYDKQG